jgi:hypothetical protein
MDETPTPPSDDANPSSRAAPHSRLSRSEWAIDAVRRRPLWGIVFLLALIVGVTLIVNRLPVPVPTASEDDPASKDEKGKDGKKKEAPKEPFTFGAFSIRPSESTRIEAGIKPGHWTAAALEARANFDDFRGELIADMHGTNGAIVDLDGVPFRLQAARPAILPKGQKKSLDVTLFDPIHHLGRQAAPRLMSRGGSEVWRTSEVVSPLPAQQYFFVVLARIQDDYRFLVSLDSVWAPSGTIEDRGQQAHYRVVLPKVDKSAPLPNHSIYWTSTAVLLWDGIDPKVLSDEQQQAIVDWLHWGGRVIVSGPESLELARDSFLAPYLPATPGDSWELDQTTLQALTTVTPKLNDEAKGLRVAQPWTGIHLLPASEETHVMISAADKQPLVVERRVGRGSTVVTAFRLAQRDLVNWPHYDALFNACLLHRPARQFERSPEDRIGVQWADRPIRERQVYSEERTNNGSYYDALDAERVSQLRYFSRDAGGIIKPTPQIPEDPFNPRRPRNMAGPITDPFADDSLVRTGPGVAAWNDESGVSKLARATLVEAAGIQIPNHRFVLTVLAAYLFVLVPLNWAVFRWLRRVELAWVAAPIIAVVFGVLVVKLAQLDIGFARSATEIAVLEVQGKYPRANLTRYCALYASLSSDYTVEFSDPAAVALPLAGGADVLTRQARDTVMLRRLPDPATGDPGVRLENLTVSSNSTGMLHSEEMFGVTGSFELTQSTDRTHFQLKNGTGLRLRAATVVIDNREAVWLDSIEPGETREFVFKNFAEEIPVINAGWSTAMQHQMKLGGLGEFAVNDTSSGETRLIAWTEDLLPGMTITPEAAQSQHATIIVAHLNYGPPRSIEVDASSRAAHPADAPTDIDRFQTLPETPSPTPFEELEKP